nr:hypothetical protein [Phaseolus vulgaris]
MAKFYRFWYRIALVCANFLKNSFEKVLVEIPRSILFNSYSALLSAILLWVRNALKKFTEVLSYVVCTQEKTILGDFFRNFVQTKAILYRNLSNFALLYAILFWIRIALKIFAQVLSYVVCIQTFFTVSIEFWLRFEPQIRPTRLAINFLFSTARAERKVRRHVHKQITKRRCGEEKQGRFVFAKPLFFTLDLRLTTPDSLGILV